MAEIIGIIGAMDQEVDGLKAAMEGVEVLHKAGLDFFRGSLFGKESVVVKCGVGKVFAALCTQILIDEYKVSMVINTGAAGALAPQVHIGDLVIANDAVQHDMNAVDFGFPLGQIPFADVFAFPADKKMADLAEEVAKEEFSSLNIHRGRICSGDEFVSRKQRKEAILDHFQGLCAEMEGAAMAQVAYANQVPFLILRAISDEADDAAGVDFPTFSAEASKRGIQLIKAMFQKL